MLAREGDDRLIWTFALLQVVADCVEVLDRSLDTAGHDHRARLAANLPQRYYLLVQVVDHDLGLELDRVIVAFDESAKFFLGPLRIKLRIALDRLDKPIVAIDRCIARKHVKNETFLNRLLHRVAVKW